MMNNALSSAALLTDTELLEHVQRCATTERDVTARLIAALAEVDARRLYLGQGCSSLFTYCIQVLHLSEHAAYGRIETARVARKFPAVLDLLADGSLHLTAISVLAAHLTADTHAALLASAQHKSKREVEQLVAALQPQPPVPATVRKLPSHTGASRPPATLSPPVEEHRITEARPSDDLQPQRIAEVKPLAPERYKVQGRTTVTRPVSFIGFRELMSARGNALLQLFLPIHGVAGHLRQVEAGAGPAATHDSARGCRCGHRPRADSARSGVAEDQARGG
jgi:hypothetical protein